MLRTSRFLKNRRTSSKHTLFSTREYTGNTTTPLDFCKQKVQTICQFTDEIKQKLSEWEEKHAATTATQFSTRENLYAPWDSVWSIHINRLCQNSPDNVLEAIYYCDEICRLSKQIYWNNDPQKFDLDLLLKLSEQQLIENDIDSVFTDLFSYTHLGHSLIIGLVTNKQYGMIAQLLDAENKSALDFITWYISSLDARTELQQSLTDKEGNDYFTAVRENPIYTPIFSEKKLIDNILNYLKNEKIITYITAWSFQTNAKKAIKTLDKKYPNKEWEKDSYLACCYITASLLEIENSDFYFTPVNQQPRILGNYQNHWEKLEALSAQGNQFASYYIAKCYQKKVSIDHGPQLLEKNQPLAKKYFFLAFLQGDNFFRHYSSCEELYLTKDKKVDAINTIAINTIHALKFSIKKVKKLLLVITPIEKKRALAEQLQQQLIQNLKNQSPSLTSEQLLELFKKELRTQQEEQERLLLQQQTCLTKRLEADLSAIYNELLNIIEWLTRNPEVIQHFNSLNELQQWLSSLILNNPFIGLHNPSNSLIQSMVDETKKIFIQKITLHIWAALAKIKEIKYQPEWLPIADIINGKMIRNTLCTKQNIEKTLSSHPTPQPK